MEHDLSSFKDTIDIEDIDRRSRNDRSRKGRPPTPAVALTLECCNAFGCSSRKPPAMPRSPISEWHDGKRHLLSWKDDFFSR